MIGLGVALALLLPSSAGSPLAAQEPATGPVYAALPMRNRTTWAGATDDLMTLVRSSLEGRGARFVPVYDLEEVLRARRIRYTDSLSAEDSAAIAALTGAEYFLAGSLLAYQSGTRPHITLALYLLDAGSGARIQSSLVSLSGSDFTGLLELGTISDVRELELEVLARVLAIFEEDGSPRPGLQEEVTRRPSRSKGVRSWFVGEDFDPAELDRVVVLPLDNRTRHFAAGLQFSEVLANEWFTVGGVQVVEASELRAALVAEKVRSIDLLDQEVLARVALRVDARYFAMGSVDNYSEDVFVGDDRFPEVEVTVRIIDSTDGRIVAASSVRRRGDAYHVGLGQGIVRNRLKLAIRVAREIVASFGRIS